MIERDKKAIERAIYHIEMIKEYMEPIATLGDFNNNSIVQDAVALNFYRGLQFPSI